MEVYKLKESEEKDKVSVGVGSPEEIVTQQGGQLQEPKVLNVEKERREHFRLTHLEQMQHCTDLPRQVTFPAHTEQGKTGQS